MFAAFLKGNPFPPVEMDGNAIDLIPSSKALCKEFS